MKLTLTILLISLLSCSKIKDCKEIRYEQTFYNYKWEVIKRDTIWNLGGITCEPGYYLNLDTVCGSFETGRWVIVKAFNRVLE
jgi:hypothetical protein